MQEDGKEQIEIMKKRTSRTKTKWKWVVQALCLGQVLAFCNSLSGVFNQSISNKTNAKDSIAACQTAMNYVFVCLTYGLYHIKVHGFSCHFTKSGAKCFANALVDVQAWYWIYKSYNFTSLTSVQALDCLSIPVAIIISKFFFHKAYNYQQYGAILFSTAGLVLIVYSDYDPADRSTAEGDLMCACGTILFGISTVCQEWVLKEMDVYQYMGTVCWYAAAFSLTQLALLEHHVIAANLAQNPHLSLWMLGLAVSQFVFYSAMPVMLQKFGCASATINLLAADAYAAVAGALIFKLTYDAFYIAGMIITILGILLYTLVTDNTTEIEMNDESSEVLIE